MKISKLKILYLVNVALIAVFSQGYFHDVAGGMLIGASSAIVHF